MRSGAYRKELEVLVLDAIDFYGEASHVDVVLYVMWELKCQNKWPAHTISSIIAELRKDGVIVGDKPSGYKRK
jgi:hypothetical protein